MPVNNTLPDDVERRLQGVGDAIAAASQDVEFAYLFGSAARGTRTARSDIDVAIHVAENADAFQTRLIVARAIARHFGSDAIDIVVLNTAPIAVAGRVLASRRVVLDRAPFARHRYESLTTRMFHDFRFHEHRVLAWEQPVVDRDLVLRKVADLDTYLVQLGPYRDLDLHAYQADWKTQRVVERTLHLAIETCMDIADHIVADQRLPIPQTGAETFETLAGAKILADELGRRLALMVGFRNILVHDYARIDPTIVLRVLKTDLRDLAAFRDAALLIV